MKVIFLDIDGVLNTESFIVHFFEFCRLQELAKPDAKKLRNHLLRDDYGNLFDTIAVKHLEWVIGVTDAKIVVSSTWRSSGLSVMQDMFRDRKILGEVIDITPSVHRDNRPFAERLERGTEIQMWLDAHPEVEGYVIFDDDNDMLPSQMPFFIQTDEKYGITLADAEKAISILNKST